MKILSPAWARYLDANVASLMEELPPANPRQVKRFVDHLNALAAEPDRLRRSLRVGRQLPVGYEHVLVTTADGDMAAVSSARRLGAVRVGNVIDTLTEYGRKTFATIERLPDDHNRPGVLRLLATGGDYPLKRDAASGARMHHAPAPS